MNWQKYVLPGDLLETAQEIDASKVSLVKAIEHLLHALLQHNSGEFEESRKLVNLAVDRLEDWERSDNELQAAFERYLADVRDKRRKALIEQSTKQVIQAEIVMFRRVSNE